MADPFIPLLVIYMQPKFPLVLYFFFASRLCNSSIRFYPMVRWGWGNSLHPLWPRNSFIQQDFNFITIIMDSAQVEIKSFLRFKQVLPLFILSQCVHLIRSIFHSQIMVEGFLFCFVFMFHNYFNLNFDLGSKSVGLATKTRKVEKALWTKNTCMDQTSRFQASST